MAMFYDWRDRTGKGFKSWREYLKELRSPLFIGLGIVLVLSLIISGVVYFGYVRPSRSVKSERVYLLPDPSERRAILNDRTTGESTDSVSQRPTDEVVDQPLADTDGLSNPIPFVSEVEPDPASVSASTADDTAAFEQPLAELEEVAAETEAALEDAALIREQAMQTIGQAIPMIVDHLNALSAEDQQDFLAEVRSQMVNLAPPEVQTLYAQNPELKDQGYTLFLEMLRENGYKPSVD